MSPAGSARHARQIARDLDDRRRRRFYVLVAASTLVPGLGLTWSRRRTGLAILGAFLALLLGVGGYTIAKGVTGSVLEVGLSRSALAVVVPAVLLVAAGWIYGIVMTAGDNLPPPTAGRSRALMLLASGVAVLLVLLPALQVARYAVIQRSLLGDVFASIRPDGAAGPGEGEDPWAGTERVNVLLIGSDAGKGRVGTRPDATMVASIDTQTGAAVLFGIPRNLENVPFSPDSPLRQVYPDGYSCGDDCLFEYVWTLGTQNAELFPGDPNPGLTVTKDAAGQVLGLDVDYTAVVNLQGFTQLVDAMGGVRIDVKERVCIGCKIEGGQVVGTTGYIEPGVQTLDGFHALWYSRSRADSEDGDFSRMRRQRCMVGALLTQVDPVLMLRRYPDLAAVLTDNVTVDIPQQDLEAWAGLVQKIQDGAEISSLPLTNEAIDVTDPDYARIHAMVQRAIDPPPAKGSSSPSSSTDGSTPSSTSEPPAKGAEDLAATC